MTPMSRLNRNGRSHVHARKTMPRRESPSVTDWIQACAVVTGIAVGIWQFVIHDQDLEQQRRKAVIDLIIVGQSSEIATAYKTIFSLGEATDDRAKKFADPLVIANLLAFEQYLNAWGFCYQTGLCDQALSVLYICPSVRLYSSLILEHYNYVKREELLNMRPPFQALMKSCHSELPKPK
jgi:hypothetical protein